MCSELPSSAQGPISRCWARLTFRITWQEDVPIVHVFGWCGKLEHLEEIHPDMGNKHANSKQKRPTWSRIWTHDFLAVPISYNLEIYKGALTFPEGAKPYIWHCVFNIYLHQNYCNFAFNLIQYLHACVDIKMFALAFLLYVGYSNLG